MSTIDKLLMFPDIVHPIASPFTPLDSVMRMVGSTYIKGAGKDVDYAVGPKPADKITPAEWDLDVQASRLADDGWLPDSEVYESDTFISMRKDGINLIVYRTYADWDRGITAAETCRALHLLGVVVDKRVRVLIHRVVQDQKEAPFALADTIRDIPDGTP